MHSHGCQWASGQSLPWQDMKKKLVHAGCSTQPNIQYIHSCIIHNLYIKYSKGNTKIQQLFELNSYYRTSCFSRHNRNQKNVSTAILTHLLHPGILTPFGSLFAACFILTQAVIRMWFLVQSEWPLIRPAWWLQYTSPCLIQCSYKPIILLWYNEQRDWWCS